MEYQLKAWLEWHGLDFGHNRSDGMACIFDRAWIWKTSRWQKLHSVKCHKCKVQRLKWNLNTRKEFRQKYSEEKGTCTVFNNLKISYQIKVFSHLIFFGGHGNSWDMPQSQRAVRKINSIHPIMDRSIQMFTCYTLKPKW